MHVSPQEIKLTGTQPNNAQRSRCWVLSNALIPPLGPLHQYCDDTRWQLPPWVVRLRVVCQGNNAADESHICVRLPGNSSTEDLAIRLLQNLPCHQVASHWENILGTWGNPRSCLEGHKHGQNSHSELALVVIVVTVVPVLGTLDVPPRGCGTN